MQTLKEIVDDLEVKLNKTIEIADHKKRAKDLLIIASSALGLVRTISSVPDSQAKIEAYTATLDDRVFEIVIKRDDQPDLVYDDLYRSFDGAIIAVQHLGYHDICVSLNKFGTIWTAKLTNPEDGNYIYINAKRLKL